MVYDRSEGGTVIADIQDEDGWVNGDDGDGLFPLCQRPTGTESVYWPDTRSRGIWALIWKGVAAKIGAERPPMEMDVAGPGPDKPAPKMETISPGETAAWKDAAFYDAFGHEIDSGS